MLKQIKYFLTAAGMYLHQNGPALLEKAEDLRRETIQIGQDMDKSEPEASVWLRYRMVFF